MFIGTLSHVISTTDESFFHIHGLQMYRLIFLFKIDVSKHNTGFYRFDIANHFNEFAGFDYDWRLYPSEEVRQDSLCQSVPINVILVVQCPTLSLNATADSLDSVSLPLQIGEMFLQISMDVPPVCSFHGCY